MSNNPVLKRQVLELARWGETFELLDARGLKKLGLDGWSCREVRRALDSLSYCATFEPYRSFDDEWTPPLIRHVCSRDHGGCVSSVRYYARAPYAAAKYVHQESTAFVYETGRRRVRSSSFVR